MLYCRITINPSINKYWNIVYKSHSAFSVNRYIYFFSRSQTVSVCLIDKRIEMNKTCFSGHKMAKVRWCVIYEKK